MDLTAVRTAIAKAVDAEVPNNYPYEPQEDRAEDYPAVWVRPPRIESKAQGRGIFVVLLEVVLAISEGYDSDTQAQADDLTMKLWPLIEAADNDPAITGSCFVESVDPVRPGETVTYQGAVFSVRVETT